MPGPVGYFAPGAGVATGLAIWVAGAGLVVSRGEAGAPLLISPTGVLVAALAVVLARRALP